MEIARLTDLERIEPLLTEAKAEGFAFLDRLRDEWRAGTLRFDQEGEILFGAFADNRLVGTAGLTRQGPLLGRVRRVYVSPTYRGHGIAKALMLAVLEFARPLYGELVLFTEMAEAARLYEGLGFQPESPDGPDHATHRLTL